MSGTRRCDLCGFMVPDVRWIQPVVGLSRGNLRGNRPAFHFNCFREACARLGSVSRAEAEEELKCIRERLLENFRQSTAEQADVKDAIEVADTLEILNGQNQTADANVFAFVDYCKGVSTLRRAAQ